MDIVIVGGGIVGLCTAYALCKSGIGVTVLDRGQIPHPHASSTDHHRLISSVYGGAVGYAGRVRAAHQAWQDLWRDLSGTADRYYARTGMLSVSKESGDVADRSRVTMETLGLPFERISSPTEVGRRFPFLDVDRVGYALLSDGGALMAERILVDLAQWLKEKGVILREHGQVTSIRPKEGAVVLASGERLEGDTVLVCAGIATSGLVPDLQVPLELRRSVVVYAEPPVHLKDAWRNGPCWTGLGGKTDFWGMPPIGYLPLKLGNGNLGSAAADDSNRTVTAQQALQMIESYGHHFKDASQYKVRSAIANYWTLAPKSRFVLERVDRAVVVSACSGHGFKFGALTGRDTADALMNPSDMQIIAARMAGRPAVSSVSAL